MTCEEWPNARTGDGYGQWYSPRDGKIYYTHRLVAAFITGRSVAGTYVRHTCDNPPCHRAEHLIIGTQQENMQDAVAKGRYQSPQAKKTHCVNGHPFDGENTRHYKERRICKACETNRRRAWEARKRAS